VYNSVSLRGGTLISHEAGGFRLTSAEWYALSAQTVEDFRSSCLAGNVADVVVEPSALYHLCKQAPRFPVSE